MEDVEVASFGSDAYSVKESISGVCEVVCLFESVGMTPRSQCPSRCHENSIRGNDVNETAQC